MSFVHFFVDVYVLMAYFSSLTWAFKLLPSKHRQTSIWQAKPFVTML